MSFPLTPWMRPNTKPIHIGWYMTNWTHIGGLVIMRYWNGKGWEGVHNQHLWWRGLCFDPAKKNGLEVSNE